LIETRQDLAGHLNGGGGGTFLAKKTNDDQGEKMALLPIMSHFFYVFSLAVAAAGGFQIRDFLNPRASAALQITRCSRYF
jgi:hypothetical protein